MLGMPLFIGWLITRLYFFSEYNSYEFLGESAVIILGVIVIGYRHGRKQWDANEEQWNTSHSVRVSHSYSSTPQPAMAADDGVFYETVGIEMQNGSFQTGLWARAFAEADGDENRARATYIRLRVAQLSSVKQELRRVNSVEQTPFTEVPSILEPARKHTTQTIIRRTLFAILALIAGLLTVLLGFCTIIAAFNGPSTQRLSICLVLGRPLYIVWSCRSSMH